jgi:hypothetical protein
MWSDISLGVSRPLHIFESTGTILTGALGASIPTSLASQTETLITSVGTQARVIQPIDSVFLSYGMGVTKNFHEYDTPIVECEVVLDGQCLPSNGGSIPIALARRGDPALVASSGIATGGLNTEYSWTNGISAMWMASAKISAMIGYTLGYSWTYSQDPASEVDLASGLDVGTGVGAKPGRGVRPSSSAIIGANYLVLPNVSLSGGVRTSSGLYDSDGQTLRFPFYEFEAEASNLSQFYLSATLTEQIPL